MIRCYITDRKAAGGLEPLAACIERAMAAGVDMIQIREKDLSARELLAFVRRVLAFPRRGATRVLVNSRLDVALAAGAQGVHLPSDSPPPARLRTLAGEGFLFGVSCHSPAEAVEAETNGADFIVFGPVFFTASKAGYGPPQGLGRLHETALRVRIPVLALGGVSVGKIQSCLDAGAAGIAGITMFQQPVTLSG